MVAPTSSHPCDGEPRGLQRVTSSLWEKSSLTGSGLPFMNSPSPSWYRSMSSSTSFAADIFRGHLHGRRIVLYQRTLSAIILRYSPECVEGKFCELRPL